MYLVEKMENRVISTADLLSVTPDEAVLFLIVNRWRQELILEKWIADPEAVRLECGVSANSDPHPSVAEITARDEDVVDPVELETYKASECDAAACGHIFPKSTWRSYLHSTLSSPLAMLSTRCIDYAPPTACTERVRPRMFRAYLSQSDFESYLRELVRSFVGSGNSGPGARLYPCPHGDCSLIVEARMMSTAKSVACSAGHAWCVSCQKEPHEPASCKTVQSWSERERDDGANTTWILANTKQCPNCKKAIEKSVGCNHMTCRREAGGCAHEFCWQCLGSWASHTAAGGGGYSCNKRPDKLSFDEEKAAVAKNNLDLYMFYWQKVVGQTADRRHAIANLEKYEVKVATMTAVLSASGFVPPFGTFQFLKEALQTVVRARLVCKYSYVHAFYLPKGPTLSLFEYAQGYLEGFLERLVSLTSDNRVSVVFQEPAAGKTLYDVRRRRRGRAHALI
jgi:ariadne-1